MHHNSLIFIGIDVGTGGVRALAVTETGQIVGRTSVAFDSIILAPQEGRHEQPAEAWWQAVCRATSALAAELAAENIPPEALAGVSVDGTSGTIVPLDAQDAPLRPAMMYNDPRSTVEAEELNRAAGDFCDRLGYRFTSSFALAKIAWLKSNEPALFDKTVLFVHQADYISGKLTGRFGVSDYSNALKTGYDLLDERWPEWIDRHLNVTDRLPRVVAPGTKILTVSATASAQTGLPRGLPVVTGASDGTAAFLASGARSPGDYNTTLGTTLVFKCVSRSICRHPDGLIYCHKLPGGLWLPGAASNTGCQWIGSMFGGGADVAAMDAAAASRLPCHQVVYPLARTGERFPFASENARPFFVSRLESEPDDPSDRYAGCLQGVAFLERLAYDVIDGVAGTSGGQVFSTGGGSRSDVWMQCRADVTNRELHRPECPESALGTAVLAAAGTKYDTLDAATEQMVRVERTFLPNRSVSDRYDQLYEQFREELHSRGYC